MKVSLGHKDVWHKETFNKHKRRRKGGACGIWNREKQRRHKVR